MNLFKTIKFNLKEGTLWGEDSEYDEKYGKLMHDYVEELIKNFKDFGWSYDDSSAKYGHYRFSKDGVDVEYCDNFDKLGTASIDSDFFVGKVIPSSIDKVNGGGLSNESYIMLDFKWSYPSAYSLASFVNTLVDNNLHESSLCEADDSSTTFEINTEVLPVLDVGTYGREDYIWSDYINQDVPEEEQPTMEDLDKVVIQFGVPIVENYIKKVFPSAKVSNPSVYHPKYYNYSTDELDFTVSVSPSEFKDVLERTVKEEGFKDFLKDKYSSHSGFISSMADDLDEFYQEEVWRRFCQVVMYQLRNEDFDSTTDEFWETVVGNF